MPRSRPDSEDTLERATIELFESLGWRAVDAYDEKYGPEGTLGREHRGEVVLVRELRAALQRLNPELPHAAIDATIAELARDRGTLGMVQANREVYELLKDGVKVTLPNEGKEDESVSVRVVDWATTANNDFLLVAQLWVAGDIYTRRADLAGFVNGLPLLFVELKAHTRELKLAYDGNFSDYKSTIPHLFPFNSLVVLSNGSATRAGSISAEWEHFAEWKRIDQEGEQGTISLETTVLATCTPQRLLDLAENFTLFDESRGGLAKLVAMNHQYLGVNGAVGAVISLGDNRGKLGVFWHTQGSGKSYSMVWFAQKVLRKLPGNWTFVIVTDRTDLDDQIYRTFSAVGAVAEPQEEVRASSAEKLKQLLGENHRYVFTLIQKFRTAGGTAYPKLSDRSDIIVITDEAHRSQYDIFAQNMRNALPNAAFIGFTGTPLLAGEEKTRAVFGDYTSIYNFRQSIDDGATVPLYYENRIPELQLTNAQLNTDMESLLEQAELDEAQEQKLEREFAREYHLITRDERLDTIAHDIVLHFMNRGWAGKAMVVSIDKATAVRMYDKVRQQWSRYLDELRRRLTAASSEQAEHLRRMIEYMQATDMAVVVSQAQNEVEEFRKKGLDIKPHRRRIVTEDLDTKFKDPNDPLRIVFVCAMWMTGFDVPSCSTVYLDKPMRNHTLMQTIARANRVFPGKLNGLIVDYVGIFRNLQHALAIYAAGPAGDGAELPIRDKSTLIAGLREAIEEARDYCLQRGVDVPTIAPLRDLLRIRAMDDAVELLLVNDAGKRAFLERTDRIDRSFRAILPDSAADEFGPLRATFMALASKIRLLTPQASIDAVMAEVNQLLDRSIAPGQGYVIAAPVLDQLQENKGEYTADHTVDLSTIDFQALAAKFEEGKKRTAAEKLRGQLSAKLGRMIRLNRSRLDYLEAFQRLIDDYNQGASNVDELFAQLFQFAQELDHEEQRHVAEQLSEEELAIFDLLVAPDLTLTRADRNAVKTITRELLATLKREKLVLDWRKKQQARAAVQVAIEEQLAQLPDAYDDELYSTKISSVFEHVYEHYLGAGKSTYARAA